jgi:inhibitor of cysteine peptidase
MAKLCFAGAAVTLALTGCDLIWPPDTGVADLERFTTQHSFKQYLADQVEAEGSRYWWAEDDMVFDLWPSAGTGDAEPAPGDTQGGDEFSTTNIQEEGVGESDVMKNDGTYLYILGVSALRIVQAVPAEEMALLSTTELRGAPDEIYLRGDTVIALSSKYDHEAGKTLTTVAILDVTDRTSPALTATIDAEGSLNTSRLIGSKLHLVLSLRPNLPGGDGDEPILESDVDALLPDLTVSTAEGEAATRDLVDWGDLYHPVDPDGYEVTAVVTLDVDAPEEPAHSVGVMANADTVYVAPTALYLTDAEYDYSGQRRETTDIYKFDLEDEGAVFVAAGSVSGRFLNRFSLGEYEGHLRTATTIGEVHRSGDNTAKNNVYVLHPEQDRLVITGKVEGIAPGERIYSARFLGPRGFLVTFKKVDPLFTLDLSDPAAPRVVGELKVPGYSDYIHPLGENHLLTIGKDAVDMGDFAWYQGVQLSVFDVTDFAEPARADVEIIGERGTESEALTNPHAFNFFGSADTLAIPMTVAEGAGEDPSSSGYPTFRGLCLFRVTIEDGIEPLGRISTEPEEGSSEYYDYYWSYDWARGVFIGDYVYTVTSTEVLASPLAALSSPPSRLLLGSR